MAFLLAIEGADGAGKATVAAAIVAAASNRGRRASVVSFPRYGETVGGHVLGDYLAGRLPRSVSPKAAATLYALDRLESRHHVLAVAESNDLIVFDRYIASNMAYQAAQVPAAESSEMMAWIETLETGAFALPRPDLSIYLDTPGEVAEQFIRRKRQRSYTSDQFDAYEADRALQDRVRDNYRMMAGTGRLGRWATVATTIGGTPQPPADLAEEILSVANHQDGRRDFG